MTAPAPKLFDREMRHKGNGWFLHGHVATFGVSAFAPHRAAIATGGNVDVLGFFDSPQLAADRIAEVAAARGIVFVDWQTAAIKSMFGRNR